MCLVALGPTPATCVAAAFGDASLRGPHACADVQSRVLLLCELALDDVACCCRFYGSPACGLPDIYTLYFALHRS